ncbi:MAG: hypothetical protein FD180_3520 [Planctomycetota bacterium]|nr:MAG: hypothetical protein FD180_3520 [Planctomycetota bacterium]
MRILAIAALLASACFADTVYMKDGRKFEGTVTEQGEEYAIKGKFGTIKVKKTDVERVDMPPTGEYASRSKALADKDVDGHFDLGLWCKEKGMKAEAKAEFEKVLRTDPHHAGAHKELGHSRVGERWGTPLELMDSVEALLRLNKADKARDMMAPLIANALDGLEKPQQARAWKIMISIELREGKADSAADAADKASEVVTATEKVAARTKAEIIRTSRDGKYDVKQEDLVTVMPGQTDPGLGPLDPGRRPLWDDRVMLIALRGVAQRDIDKGKKLANDAWNIVGSDKEKAFRLYASAEDFYDHANEIVPDFGRQYQVEAVGKQVPILFDIAVENVDKADAANPLVKSYGLVWHAGGALTFTGDGLARYQDDKRTWNAYAGKIEECMKDISRLNNRFPAEFSKHKIAYDKVDNYFKKRIPEIRAWLDKIEKALK